MLRQVEKDLRQHYYDPTFHGVDLTARVRDAEQRLQTAAGFNDAVASVSDLLAELDDSHTAFLPPTRSIRVDYGWEMALVGDVPLVVRVEPGSDAAAKGLAPGDRVLLLNAVEPKRGNLERLAYFYRYVRPQAMQRVAILKPDGSARTLDVRSAVERHACESSATSSSSSATPSSGRAIAPNRSARTRWCGGWRSFETPSTSPR